MAETAHKIRAIIEVRDDGTTVLKNFRGEVEKTSQQMKKTSREQAGAVTVLNRLRGSYMLLAGALGIGALGIHSMASSFIDAASTAEQYEVRLKALLGSQEEGAKVFKDMADYAASVPFEYEKIMGSATMLAGILKGGSKEITEWIPLIGDLAAAVGLDIQLTTSQVMRMLSAGAQAAEMFRERGVLAMLGFKSGVSYTVDETKKMLIDAWKDPESKFKGVTDELAKTWQGKVSMMKDAWFAFRNAVMEAGLFDAVKMGLDALTAAIKKMDDTVRPAVETLNQWKEWLLWFDRFTGGVDWSEQYGDATTAVRRIIDVLRGLRDIETGELTDLGELEYKVVPPSPSDIRSLEDSLAAIAGGLTIDIGIGGIEDALVESRDATNEMAENAKKQAEALKKLSLISPEAYRKGLEIAKKDTEAFFEFYKGVTEAKSEWDAKRAEEERTKLYESLIGKTKTLEMEKMASSQAYKEMGLYHQRMVRQKVEVEGVAAQDAIGLIQTQVDEREKQSAKAVEIARETVALEIEAQEVGTQALVQAAEQQLIISEQHKMHLIEGYDELSEYQKKKASEYVALEGWSAEQAVQTASNLVATKKVWGQKVVDWEKINTEQKIELGKQETARASDNMRYIAEHTKKHKKEMFAVWKAFAIAETIIDTYQSAQAAFKALAGIPVVGPALGAAAAGVAVAAGLMRVSVIASQSPGYAEGGIATGPATGYIATLHGTEAIVPLGADRQVPVEIRGAPQGLSESAYESVTNAKAYVSLPGGRSLPANINISESTSSVRTYAGGGLSVGTDRGYQVMLHGTEAVIPVSPDDRTVSIDLYGIPADVEGEVQQFLSGTQTIIPLPGGRGIKAILSTAGYARGGIAPFVQAGVPTTERAIYATAYYAEGGVFDRDKSSTYTITANRFASDAGRVDSLGFYGSTIDRESIVSAQYKEGGLFGTELEKTSEVDRITAMFAEGGMASTIASLVSNVSESDRSLVSSFAEGGMASTIASLVTSSRESDRSLVSSFAEGGMASTIASLVTARESERLLREDRTSHAESEIVAAMQYGGMASTITSLASNVSDYRELSSYAAGGLTTQAHDSTIERAEMTRVIEAGFSSNLERLADFSSDVPSLEGGGIVTGPASGYPVMLHGTEKVIPLSDEVQQQVAARPVEEKTVNVILKNPTFQDLETQRQTMMMIARTITERLAPQAIYDDYYNDGIVRKLMQRRE